MLYAMRLIHILMLAFPLSSIFRSTVLVISYTMGGLIGTGPWEVSNKCGPVNNKLKTLNGKGNRKKVH